MPAKAKSDKRVYDVRASDDSRTRVVAVSADSTLLDLHLALLGTFGWKGDYDVEERGAYCVTFPRRGKGGESYTEGRGSRTPLRRLLNVGERFACTAGDRQLELDCEVVREYEVPSRRHHPKVLDAGGDAYEARVATWRAQEAVRRWFRDPPFERLPQREPLVPAYAHGMYAAVVSGPMVMPSAWLPEVMRMPELSTLEDAQRESARVMGAYNAVAHALHEAPERFIDETARLLSADEDGSALKAWVRGFVHGMALAGDQWQKFFRDDEFRAAFEPIATVMQIAETPDQRGWLDDATLRLDLAHACPIAAARIWKFWRQKAYDNVLPMRRVMR